RISKNDPQPKGSYPLDEEGLFEFMTVYDCKEVDKMTKSKVVSPSIVPSGNFAELIRTVTCMVFKANDRRTSSPLPDESREPRSDCGRQVA
ncbi:hypothetical protein TNCV_1635131, partial [Trichonephila clavipes]